MSAGHECYHCKRWIEAGEAHDCWTTTEAALTRDLSDDLRDAYERLREAAAELGEQRIYASHHSIMFARRTCYAFVRPKRTFLELVVFLARTVRAPQVRRADASSRTKVAHVIPVRHRDQVEAPITDWLREAYALQDPPAPAEKKAGGRSGVTSRRTATPARSRPGSSSDRAPDPSPSGRGRSATRNSGRS